MITPAARQHRLAASAENRPVLGIDAGGTCTRWLIMGAGGEEVARGEAKPISGHLFTAAERDLNLRRLSDLLDTACQVADVRAVAAGITGLHAGTTSEALFRTAIGRVCSLADGCILVDNDMRVAYESAFAPGAGVLVYAGTGSAGYFLDTDGRSLRVGGHGLLVDDAGGSYWIGHQALKQTLRWADETGVPSRRPLAQEVYKELGSAAWNDIAQALYAGVLYADGRQAVAALSPAVARAAQRDEAAAAILEGAGLELARLANTVLKRVGKLLPVALMGGSVKAGRPLVDAFQAHLPTGVTFSVVDAEPVRAAARIAASLCPLDK